MAAAGAAPDGGCGGLVEVLKSPQDKKLYRYLRLDSGMSVLLISDPDINSSGADQDQQDGDNGSVEGSGKGTKRARLSEGSEEGDDMSQDEGEEEEGESGEDEEGEDEEEDEGEDGLEEEDGEGGAKGKKHEAQKKAAAAMAVGVGSFSDPPHMQGLSHYLEHMLFMGSTKYPNENDYDDYITKHGGSNNAYTELEVTNYHFEVAPNALQGALDRFAQFFLSPLCLEGALEREVRAVDSEFAGVRQDDACRASQLVCHTAEEGHLYRAFSWGNKKSLWDEPKAAGVDIRGEVLKHYNQHYSAERMSLVLLGGESLDTLQAWVQEAFAGLPSGKGPRPSFGAAGMPFKGRNLYAMPSVRDQHEVSLTFPLPCLFQHYGTKSDHYISHLVGHEGPGSLLSALKARGWATEVCAGIDSDGHSQNSACHLFGITLTLTEAGLREGPGLGLAPVALAFQYMAMLAKQGPQEWVWQELKGVAEMKFLFQEEEDAMDTVTRIASGMHLCAPQHVLCMDLVHERWDPQLVSELLASMQAQGTYRIDLQTKSFDEVRGAMQALATSHSAPLTEILEPWFEMPALAMPLPESLSNAWATQSIDPTLRLPPVNPYVPTDFSLRASAEARAEGEAAAREALAAQLGLPVVLSMPPTMLLDKPGLRLWHKLDVTFHMPKAAALFRLSSPAMNHDPRTSAAGHMLLKLLEDVLNEDAYLADVAGLHYHLSLEGLAGIEVRVEGFSHKLPLLTQRLFQATATAAKGFDGAAFAREKEALVRKYKNTNMQVPKHASYCRLLALCSGVPHVDAVLEQLQALQPEDVSDLATKILSSCHLEALVHGNLTADEARTLAQSAADALGPGCCMAVGERSRERCVSLPQGAELVHREKAKNAEEENAAIECYFQCCTGNDFSDRAMVDLLDHILSEPVFNQLRTKQQLGYTVYCGMRLTHGVLGFCFGVVSSKFPSETLETRVEAFIQGAALEPPPEPKQAGGKGSKGSRGQAAGGKGKGAAGARDKDSKCGKGEGEDVEGDQPAAGPLSRALLTAEAFAKQRAALQSIKLQRDRSLHDECMRHWDNVWNQRYDFMTRERELRALDDATPDGLRAWFQRYVAQGASHRRKLVVHIQPGKPCAAASADASVVAQPVVQPPAKGQRKAAQGKGRRGKDSGAGAVGEARREVLSDLLAWRGKQDTYPEVVGPDPPAIKA